MRTNGFFRARIALLFALATTPAFGAATTPTPTPSPSWEVFDRSDNLILSRRDVPGSDLVAFKGEGTVDWPILKVASVLLDHSREKEWVDHLEEVRIVRRPSPLEFIDYTHVGTPFIIKDRDFVLDVVIGFKPELKQMTLLFHSIEDPAVPETSYVRGRIIGGGSTLTSINGGKSTQMVAEIHVDPKGSVPKWIVNLFQKSWPRTEFERLKTQLAKPDITVPNEFKDALKPISKY